MADQDSRTGTRYATPELLDYVHALEAHLGLKKPESAEPSEEAK